MKCRIAISAAVLVAMLAAASGARAAEFHAEEAPLTVEGAQVSSVVFSIEGNRVECGEATFTGASWNTASPELTLTPSYELCTAFGFEAHVAMSTCDYLFEAFSATVGDMRIDGCGASTIGITPTFLGASVCTITVGGQNPGGEVYFTNLGSGSERDVRVTLTVDEITADVEGGGGACGAEGHHAGLYGGKLTGSLTAKGFNEAGEQQGMWVE